MARAFFPAPKFRSALAVPGVGNISDKMVYSSIVAGHGGGSGARAFTVPMSGAIVRMMGAAIAPTETHHLLHDFHSTNLEKPSEMAGSIGDARIRAIAVKLENARPLAAGSFGTYGMTPADVCEFLAKIYSRFYVGGNDQITTPVSQLPAAGGPNGTVFCAAAGTATGIVSNGSSILGGKRLRVPIAIGQTDLISMLFQSGNGSTLTFAVTTGVGQASLVTTYLSAFTRSDVRA